MLNHPDPHFQYILTKLEMQRDELIVENGRLVARIAELSVQTDSPEEVDEQGGEGEQSPS